MIRSGYGIMYGRYSTAALNTLFSANNNCTATYTLQPGSTAASLLPTYPNILASSSGLAAAGAATIEFAAPNLRAPYTEQGDFAVARAIGKNDSLTVSYLWDRGVRLFSIRDLNQPDVPPTDVMYSILSSQGGPVIGTFTTPVYLAANRINPACDRVLPLENGGNSYYSGMSVQFVHRMSHGFQADLDCTWSHAIDGNLGGSSNFRYLSGVSSTLYNGNYQGVKGRRASINGSGW